MADDSGKGTTRELERPPSSPTADQGRGLEIGETRAITETEHGLGFWEAVCTYPQAAFWAMFFCIAVVMAGFDAQIITSFYALPAFQRKYGDRIGDHWEISAPWQTGLGMGNPIGQAVGAMASGYPLQRLGRRKTLAVCCCWSIGFVFVQFFATSIGMLCAGEILAGLAYGFYVVIAPTYASEICPVVLRGILTASVNLAFVVGQFIAQGCAAGVESRLDEWAYRVPFVSASARLNRDIVSNERLGRSVGVARCAPRGIAICSGEPILARASWPQKRSTRGTC